MSIIVRYLVFKHDIDSSFKDEAKRERHIPPEVMLCYSEEFPAATIGFLWLFFFFTAENCHLSENINPECQTLVSESYMNRSALWSCQSQQQSSREDPL